MDSRFIEGTFVPLIYLMSAVLFIVGLRSLTRVRTAREGNALASFAMLLAVFGTLMEIGYVDYRWILGGLLVGGLVGSVAAARIPMTAMPELVALFNGFGGGASALVGMSVFWQRYVEVGASGTGASVLSGVGVVTIALTVLIGGVTFAGSFVALLKLRGWLKKGAPILLPGRHALNTLLVIGTLGAGAWFGFLAPNAGAAVSACIALLGLSLLLGVLLVIPIGGADMPVVVSLLNSYSGMAACAAGFVIGNPLLIIAGALVGSAGLILTEVMCRAMNRSLLNVLSGGFGLEEAGGGKSSEYTNVRSAGAEEAAMILESAESVVIVPGYGLAVAQAQYAVHDLADLLEKRGARVRYAIHPVAGRMPGHMNVLLAEADVPYEKLVEMDEINPDLRSTAVSLVIGANDVVNPAANTDESSPIYGMPILEVQNSRTVLIVKRSLSPGYAGIKNELFEYDNTMMVFGDAKQVIQDIINEMKQL